MIQKATGAWETFDNSLKKSRCSLEVLNNLGVLKCITLLALHVTFKRRSAFVTHLKKEHVFRQYLK